MASQKNHVDFSSAGPFDPPIYIRSASLQTFLPSVIPWRKPKEFLSRTKRTLYTHEDVILRGALTNSVKKPKGLAILLHGWEGQMDSPYVMKSAAALFEEGWDVFRLNFRDHGDSHHMNIEIFNGTMIDEIEGVLSRIAKPYGALPIILGGFSLGGNFALRLSIRSSQNRSSREIRSKKMDSTKISSRNNSSRKSTSTEGSSKSPKLKIAHCFAVSPPLDPFKATQAMDSSRVIGRHLYKVWQRSLRRKEEHYPELYDFEPYFKKEKSLYSLTDALIKDYTQFKNAKHYFAQYTITKKDILSMDLNTTILTAKDDQIIPVDDFYSIVGANPKVQVMITDHGGHVGFMPSLKGEFHYVTMLRILANNI